MFQPRPKQQEVLNYVGGKMGVAAVPGSGKTQTLSYLAALLVIDGRLPPGQEVLVVTLVNSAVENFAARVKYFVQAAGLLPRVGYRVRTLHGLAHDIVRERPGLVDLADDFQIVDEREAERVVADACAAWLRSHSYDLDAYLAAEVDEQNREKLRRDRYGWPQVVRDVAFSVIKKAKDLELTPEDLRRNLDLLPEPLPLLEMGLAVYSDYQRGLAYRGAVDFDDLIRLALLALRRDREYLGRLRERWPYILEDEAQDSSQLQERILRMLAGPDGNWVRVGDPNQAIFETFTTASPQFLRDFLEEPGVVRRELPNSGRSAQGIMNLANYLVSWTQNEHPVPAVRGALSGPPIEPTPPGDPQANPPDDPAGIRLVAQGFTPAEEIQYVVDSVGRYLQEHAGEETPPTLAVLVPRNGRGDAVIAALKARAIPYVELLQSTEATRSTAGVLANLLKLLDRPTAPEWLATAYRVWRRHERGDDAARARLEHVSSALRDCRQVEDFLWPAPNPDSLAALALNDEDETLDGHVRAFRDVVRRWQAASTLPVDQVVLTLAQDLFVRPADLALSYRLASLLRTAGRDHPDWRLGELADELALIARNERKFLGFSDEDGGFDPEKHRGKVVVATVHKAKGLEWDRVYLMSANNYDYPSALPHDEFIAEKWFVRGHLNLVAEAQAQLAALMSEDSLAPYVEEGAATARARLDYACERLRLLYVGITRAKRELIVTWNTGRGRVPCQPATPFIALQTWWERNNIQPGGEA